LKDAGDGKRVNLLAAPVVGRFWSALDSLAEPVLLHEVSANGEKYAEGVAKSPWGEAVQRAALDAFEVTCPRRAPRQIQAYAAGLSALLRAEWVNAHGEPSAEGGEGPQELKQSKPKRRKGTKK